ncbi:MAG: thioredoxin family protein [Bacteroidetes bacterium]|nr:thioredoxin family protein [Bacteroidota bacterium]
MKTGKFLLTAFFIFTFFSAAHSQTSQNFDSGLKAAKSSGKMIVLDIYSDSDNWSKKMDAEVLSSSKVQSALGGFVFIRLNIDDGKNYSYNGKTYASSDLAKIFGGTGYPSFSFMNPDGSIIKFKYNGDEVLNISGYISEGDFIEMLDFFSSKKYKDTDLSTVFTN